MRCVLGFQPCFYVIVTYLICHYHRGAAVDSQDRKLCLDRQEVEDLGDGLLIGAVGKHNAVESSAGQKLTHLGAQKTLSAEQKVGVC